jgi:multidrug resistance efflux pump
MAAEAQHSLAQRGFRSEDLKQAEANLKFAQEEFNRAAKLFAQNAVAQRQYDDAATKLAVAREIRNKLKSGLLPEEKETAIARLNLALAQEEQVKKMIKDAEVVSPIDGVVTQKSVEEGDDVLVNARLFRVSKLDPANLMIYVSEVELAKVRLGQPANVYIDAFPQKPFGGKVVYISTVAEFTPKNVQTKDDRTKLVFGVKIEVPNHDFALKPGMPADGELLNGTGAAVR